MNPSRRRALALALAAAMPACSFAPVDVEPRRSVIGALPSDIPAAAPTAATLLVLPMGSAAAYDTTQMAYSTAAHEIAYFAKNEWADTPAHMLNALLVRTLESTRRFRAVVTAPQAARVEDTLATDLVELRQDFTADPPTLRLALRAELRDAAGRAIDAKTFEATQPMGERSPQGGVAAANTAAAHVLRDVARFVVERAS